MSTLSAALEARDKATKGKWNYDHETGRIYANDGEKIIAEFDTIGPETDEEVDANGETCSAAPAALDWIAKALPYLRGYRLAKARCGCSECLDDIPHLDALIAQAEGKEVGE